MNENKRFTIKDVEISDHEKKRLYDLRTFDGVISVYECLNELHEQLEPLQKVCEKYNIPLEDLPGTLEEYIANDNDGYAGYSKCDDCKHGWEVKE